MLQCPVIVIEFHQKIRGKRPVDPLGRILDGIIFRLPGDRVAEHDSADGHAAEQSDVVFLHRTDPVRRPFLIHLKAQVVKDIGRVPETQMPVDIPVKMIAGRVFHPLFQLYKFRVLGRHIDLDIGRDALAVVGQPFDQAGIPERRYTHRAVLVIDLGIQFIHLELGNHIHHAPHLPVPEKGGRIPVQERDLVKGQFLDIFRKLSGLHGQKLLIFLRVHDRRGKERTDQVDDHPGGEDPHDHLQPLGLLQFICIQSFPADIDSGDNKDKDPGKYPDLRRMDVERRQRGIIINPEREHCSHDNKDRAFYFVHSLLILLSLLIGTDISIPRRKPAGQ